MVTRERFHLGDIPVIVWGTPSDRVYLHVHGRQSRKEYAEQFAALAALRGWQTLSFDLPEHGERTDGRPCDVWNGTADLTQVAAYARERWGTLALYACSLGAYFSLNALAEAPLERVLFQSPIVDMGWLVRQMMAWAGVTEEELREKLRIPTPIDTLSWPWYCHILAHPITAWPHPTRVLYAGRDALQPRDAINTFCERFGAVLTVSPESEHPFMAPTDEPIVRNWLEQSLCP